MKNTIGNNVCVTLFGESHGASIGAVIDGIAPGIKVDTEFIKHQLSLRRPSGSISTSRIEKDEFEIVSGIFNGYTTGTPICILIPNNDVKSSDYDRKKDIARPGHADFSAQAKYHGFEDYRGSGHFSGRITAAIVAAGAIIISALSHKGIKIGSHIKSCAGIFDAQFSSLESDIDLLNNKSFPVLDESIATKMKAAIDSAKAEGDSVGGILETAIIGMPAGVGEPWFDSIESLISHAVFSVPGVKGIEFGAGFKLSEMKGSIANDPFYIEDGKVLTKTNNNGGINGGITNGMPIIFSTAIKPTPTISKSQETVDLSSKENTMLSSSGRHDPCIVHRARVVIDSITAIVLCDVLSSRYGTDWLVK